jgi:tyrosyl-tRNA synthetase
MHLRKFGHKPFALVGGATGMIGDPSGKSNERNLLDEATLNHNVEGIKGVLSRFLDFNATDAQAPVLVNNYDWMKDFSFIDFVREVGKRITVNYMMSKDSVKKRLSGEGEGMSFTEFTYQLIQGYDFYHLHKHHNCKLQMGGSDQWGNITTGTELIRRMNVDSETEGKAFAMTCPLITKADGSKFGKSEKGNIWLDADKTSPYEFYQFWFNTTDVDAEKYIKIFTFLDKATIDALLAEHTEAPHLRVLQKKLAEEVTVMIHGAAEYEKAVFASQAFFKPTVDDLKLLDLKTLADVFQSLDQAEVTLAEIEAGYPIVDAFVKSGFLSSGNETILKLSISPPLPIFFGLCPQINKDVCFLVLLPLSSYKPPLLPLIRLIKDICLFAHSHILGVQSKTGVSFIRIIQRADSLPLLIPKSFDSLSLSPASLPS